MSIAIEETEENTSAGLDELPPAYITVSAGVPMVRSRDELGVMGLAAEDLQRS